MGRDYRKNDRAKTSSSYAGSRESGIRRPDFGRSYDMPEDPYGMGDISRRKGPGPTRPARPFVSVEQYSRSGQDAGQGRSGGRPVKYKKGAQEQPRRREVEHFTVGGGTTRARIYRPGDTTLEDEARAERERASRAEEERRRAKEARGKKIKAGIIIACSVLAAAYLIWLVIMVTNSFKDTLSDNKKTLYFWADCGNDSAMAEYLKRLTDEYNRSHSNVDVVLRTDFNDYTATITYRYREKTKTTDGRAPDINLVYGSAMRDMLAIGNICDISADLAESGMDYASVYDGLMVENVNVKDGAVYALPFVVNTYATAYNADLFARLNVQPEDIPRTVEGLTAMNKNFTSLSTEDDSGVHRIYGFSLPTDDPNQWLYAVTQMGRAHGVSTFDYSTLTRRYTVLTDLVAQLMDSEKMTLKGIGDYSQTLTLFARGDVAAVLADYDSLRRTMAAENSSFRMVSSRIPEYLPYVQPEPADIYSVTYVEINKNVNNRAAAFDFVMYLLRGDNMNELYRSTGYIPANWHSLDFKPTVDPAYEAFFNFENRISLPEPKGTASEGVTLAGVYNQIRDHLQTPVRALTTLQDQENESIKSAIRNGIIKADDYTIYDGFYKD